MALNAKQERFCNEYLIDLNATQAALRAGYSDSTAYSIGWTLLKKVEISNYIIELKAKWAIRMEISTERVLQEYAKIAFSDVRNLFDGTGELKNIDDLDTDDAGAIASVEVEREEIRAGQETIGTSTTKKIKMWDKIRALDALGKHLGLFEKDNDQRKPDLSFMTATVVKPLDE